MNKILLCCAAGMSTSMLVQRMEKYAAQNNIDVEINAIGFDEFSEQIQNYDCCLLGPQIKYKLAEFKQVCDSLNKPITVINTMDYGMMNGEKILNETLKMITSDEAK
ncbi:PTS sugar transporter subunit IIB [Rouxiella badensis]|jgi:PTS system cellobiose-specific IIB component|uniref:PTS sugar transporter subunit IIB n=1 Tax=Rouxiella badensis TaxID=1646377 RepID=A0A1X0WFK0_9GAMM|nr:PTS sugar transporter subunit IIB [Rouxiella badensis]MCC3720035.1 PTS sugar transporter subunit IIB [Rouxiella badensis]MCC3729698.1 PTS sugar transporter subunit IIB [Rouxiella badensis]MCC3731419.1 PTS sugar transporter subunit IIB [Rouxiella badensis]MCC3738354.1 PTS sugar transporter subunit IIB [Rouxiella badensis]MCC3748826.1 PTS sugar transporter subunit IIB [Rouxiella badensis]